MVLKFLVIDTITFDKKEKMSQSPSLDEHIKKLEAFQNRALKKLVPCPRTTSPAVVRVLTGIMPIRARIDILKLRYFWKITHAKKIIWHILS